MGLVVSSQFLLFGVVGEGGGVVEVSRGRRGLGIRGWSGIGEVEDAKVVVVGEVVVVAVIVGGGAVDREGEEGCEGFRMGGVVAAVGGIMVKAVGGEEEEGFEGDRFRDVVVVNVGLVVLAVVLVGAKKSDALALGVCVAFCG